MGSGYRSSVGDRACTSVRRVALQRTRLGLVGTCVCLLMAGCGGEPETPERPLAGVRLTLMALEGPRIGGLAITYAHDWAQRSGAQVTLTTRTPGKLAEAVASAQSTCPADVVICPADWAGELLGRGLSARLPDWLTQMIASGEGGSWRELIASDFDWADVLPRARDRLGAWGRHAAAMPYSGQAMVCYYRTDLFGDPKHQQAFKSATGSDLRAPATWTEYERLARYFHQAGADGRAQVRYGTTEPGGELLTDTFFAHAAALMYDPEQLSFEFDLQTIEPRIALPGFVRALKRMIGLAPAMPKRLPVAKHRQVFLDGQAAMALDTLELAVRSANVGLSKVGGKVGYALLPGSRRVYDPGSGTLATRDQVNRVMVVPGGVWGAWVVVVCAPEDRRDAAFALGAHLCATELSRLGVTDGITFLGPFRRSHVAKTAPWQEMGFTPTSAAAWLQTVTETQQHARMLVPLRIPGGRHYRDALQRAIEAALSGRQAPAKALADAATRWQAITDELGRDTQRNAYRQSLGLSVRK